MKYPAKVACFVQLHSGRPFLLGYYSSPKRVFGEAPANRIDNQHLEDYRNFSSHCNENPAVEYALLYYQLALDSSSVQLL